MRASHDQESLYRGLRFRLSEIRGDWKAHQHTWGLNKAAFTSNNVCHVCQASRTTACWTLQRGHEYSRVQFDLCSRVPLRMIRWCSMHSVQLGIELFSNGACFYELMEVGWFPGNTPAERYRSAFRKFEALSVLMGWNAHSRHVSRGCVCLRAKNRAHSGAKY